MTTSLDIPTAQVFEPLLHPARYKALWGGRGSGKSHDRAAALIEDSIRYPGLRSVCIREVQKSLMDSAKRLIEDKLRVFGLGTGQGFRVFKDSISTPGGGVIVFHGMQDHTAESIKSLEGFGRAWIEEAQTMSAVSLKLLRPTIRSSEAVKQTELWFTWNPRRKTDPVDVLFRQQQPPTNSLIVKANWNDNPWFPEVLEQERRDCLAVEPEQYDHIWEGGYVTIADGAYFARHLNEERLEGRISAVTADPNLTCRVFVDIGGTGARADSFVMWIAQFVGTQIRWIDYYEAQGQDVATHLAWLRSRKYTPDRTQIWLPHDGATQDRVIDISYESALQGAGYSVTVVPNQGRGAAKIRIDEARRLFSSMWFDEERCAAGLESLGWYHEKRDAVRNVGLGPSHDWSSHAADAFGLGCIVHDVGPQRVFKPIRVRGWRG